jgi:hydroxypyruvate reductase
MALRAARPHRLKEHALAIFRAGVAAVEPRRAVRACVRLAGNALMAGGRRLPLPGGARVFVVGAGKAAAPMAAAVEEIFGDRVAGGLVVTKVGHGEPLRKVELREAGHPVPDEAGVRAARDLAALLGGVRRGDLVVCVISGGGSSLLPSPAEGIALEEKQEVTRLLLACGAAIGEVNAVRKHLSLLKGGGLARLARPAALLSLVLSDVVGDPLDVVASGPTVPDPSTFGEALEVLSRRGILSRVPASVRARLEAGARGELPETPKAGDPAFERAANVLVGTNALAMAAAARKARALGYRTLVLSTTVTGETREVAGVHAAIAREIAARCQPLPRPACILSGGETTVTLRGGGRGGRNQEFALAAALGIAGLPEVAVLSAGTDGTDGPTDAAGAVADGETVERARAAGLDPRAALDQNDAYPFFQALGDLVMTGPTRTNVMDLRLVLAGRAAARKRGRRGGGRRARSPARSRNRIRSSRRPPRSPSPSR